VGARPQRENTARLAGAGGGCEALFAWVADRVGAGAVACLCEEDDEEAATFR